MFFPRLRSFEFRAAEASSVLIPFVDLIHHPERACMERVSYFGPTLPPIINSPSSSYLPNGYMSRMLGQVARTSSHLHELVFAKAHESCISLRFHVKDEDEFVIDLPHLQALRTSVPLSTFTLQHLGRLSNLQCLDCRLSHTFDAPALLDDGPHFATLKEVILEVASLDHAIDFTTAISSFNLASISFHVFGASPQVGQCTALARCLAQHPSREAICNLKIQDNTQCVDREEKHIAQPWMDIIEHLSRVPNLRHLLISVSWARATGDADYRSIWTALSALHSLQLSNRPSVSLFTLSLILSRNPRTEHLPDLLLEIDDRWSEADMPSAPLSTEIRKVYTGPTPSRNLDWCARMLAFAFPNAAFFTALSTLGIPGINSPEFWIAVHDYQEQVLSYKPPRTFVASATDPLCR
jgi:hypothetical protein